MSELNDQQLAAKWAYDMLQAQNFCILDTETTGLGNQDEICQIAILNWDGTPLLESNIKPTVPISPDASAIHGISADQVWGSPQFVDELIHILRAVGKRDLVIYNAEFDLRLFKQSLKPYGIQLAFPTSDRRQCRIFTNGGSIHCAMLQYSAWCGEWNSHYGNYRWQKLPGGDHSAMGDCKATLEIIKRMAASLPNLLATNFGPDEPDIDDSIPCEREIEPQVFDLDEMPF